MDARRDGYDVGWCVLVEDGRIYRHANLSYPELEDTSELKAILDAEFQAFTARIESILKGESLDEACVPVFRAQDNMKCVKCGGFLYMDGYCCDCKAIY